MADQANLVRILYSFNFVSKTYLDRSNVQAVDF